MQSQMLEARAARQLYERYDAERRLRITRFVAPSFTAITLVILIGMSIYTIQPHAPPQGGQALPPGLVNGSLFVLVICIVFYLYGTYCAFHNQVRAATYSVTAAILTATLITGNVWVYSQGIGPFVLACYMLLPLVIVLIGTLAGPAVVIFATVLMSVNTCTTTFLAPSPPDFAPFMERDGLLLALVSVGLEWCFALVMVSASRAQRKTLQELGDVRLAYERAQQLDEIKDQFIRSVNHELRNPVMALHGYVRLLQAQTLPPDTQREFIERANRAGGRLVALLNRILDTSRLDRETQIVTHEALSLREIVMEASQSIDTTEGRFDQRDLTITVPAELAVWGDRVYLQQVLTNILSNAVKYSPAAAPITISAHAVELAPTTTRWRSKPIKPVRMIELRVRDRGLGIPPEQQLLLFQRFMRLPRDLMSAVSGSGLGLYLCKQLIEAMNGTIWVESTGIEGEGTTVCMRLPIPLTSAPMTMKL